MSLDLNADLGEEITDDAALLELVTSANVACGYHAGTPGTMRAVCGRAAALGVSVGAQVSYADRAGFGRRPLDVPPQVLAEQVADQVGTLREIARSEGVVVRYLKPHGALYHRVVDDEDQARSVLAGSDDLPVLGLPGGVLLRLAQEAGRTTFTEAFPDRGYMPDGRLVPRGEPGALVVGAAEVARRAVQMAEQGRADSLCLHGDTPGAVQHARAVRSALEASGFELAGL